MSFSDYLENKVLGYAFGGASWTAPTSLSVALYSAAPSDSGGGTELSGSGYARVSITTLATNMTVSGTSPTQVVNTNNVDFAAASGTWATATHAAIFDNSGNMLDWGALTTSKTLTLGDVFRFAAGALKVTLD